jgi:DNA invertase Pin-like site-specific DNA recombinase
MKRAVLYTRVSTCDQNPETQALDFRRLAEQRGFEIVHEYTDRISGAKAKRPALDQMLAAAHRREFDTVLVWAADRLARSVRHFLEVLDTLNHLGIESVSFWENLDTGGPRGRAVVIIVSAVAELERNLIIESVRAGVKARPARGASTRSEAHRNRPNSFAPRPDTRAESCSARKGLQDFTDQRSKGVEAVQKGYTDEPQV